MVGRFQLEAEDHGSLDGMDLGNLVFNQEVNNQSVTVIALLYAPQQAWNSTFNSGTYLLASWQGIPILTIGSNQLKGKISKLKKPFAVMEVISYALWLLHFMCL